MSLCSRAVQRTASLRAQVHRLPSELQGESALTCDIKKEGSYNETQSHVHIMVPHLHACITPTIPQIQSTFHPHTSHIATAVIFSADNIFNNRKSPNEVRFFTRLCLWTDSKPSAVNEICNRTYQCTYLYMCVFMHVRI